MVLPNNTAIENISQPSTEIVDQQIDKEISKIENEMGWLQKNIFFAMFDATVLKTAFKDAIYNGIDVKKSLQKSAKLFDSPLLGLIGFAVVDYISDITGVIESKVQEVTALYNGVRQDLDDLALQTDGDQITQELLDPVVDPVVDPTPEPIPDQKVNGEDDVQSDQGIEKSGDEPTIVQEDALLQNENKELGDDAGDIEKKMENPSMSAFDKLSLLVLSRTYPLPFNQRIEKYGNRFLTDAMADLKTLASNQGLSNNPLVFDTYHGLEKIQDGLKNGTITNADQFKQYMSKKDLIGKDLQGLYKEMTDAMKDGKPDKVIEIANQKGQKMIEIAEKEQFEIQEKAKQELQTYEDELTKETDPKKREKLQKELQKKSQTALEGYNKQIAGWQKGFLKGVAYVEPNHLKILQKDSKALASLIKLNGGFDNFVQNSRFGKLGKHGGKLGLMGLGLGLFGAGSTSNMLSMGLDMGFGMVPVFGGMYDIYMAARGKDLQGNEMVTSEKLTRLGFGVLGLIPGVGSVVKAGVVGSKLAKGVAGSTKIIKGVTVIEEGAKLVSKVSSFGFLGYELATAGFSVTEFARDGVDSGVDRLHDEYGSSMILE